MSNKTKNTNGRKPKKGATEIYCSTGAIKRWEPHLKRYYFSRHGGQRLWWFRRAGSNDDFQETDQSTIRLLLKAEGFSSKRPFGATISPLEQELLRLRLRDVPVVMTSEAGFAAGLWPSDGKSVLILKSTPAAIE